jgi:hypothetical protein
VSNARTGCGSRAHRNAIADVSTGSFKGVPPSSLQSPLPH